MKHKIFKTEKDANLYLERQLGGTYVEPSPHRMNFHFAGPEIRATTFFSVCATERCSAQMCCQRLRATIGRGLGL